jgi:PAS domain S-box-containing protein
MNDEARTPPFPFTTDITFQRGDVVFATDKRGRLVYWNRESEQLFGYAAGDVLGNPFDVICLAASSGSEISLPAIMAGQDFAGGVRCSNKSGRELALYVYATAGRSQSGTAAGVVFVARDVSEFWRAEEAVLASDDRYRILFEQSSDAVVLCDLQGRILEANPSTAALTGFTRDELVRMSLRDLLPPGKVGDAESALARLREAGAITGRVDIRHRDGRALTVGLRVSLVSIAGEQRLLVVSRDAGDRVRAEQATLESERKYRTVFESANDAVFIETVDGSMLDVNNNACKLLGYTREELLGMKVPDLVPAEARAWLPRVTDAILRDRAFRTEAVNVHKSGREIPVEISGSTMELDGRTVVLTIVRDISERKRAEAALAESEDRYRTLFNDSLMGIYRTTPDGQIQLANPALVRMLGYESFAQLAERNLEDDSSGPDYKRDEFKRRIERDGRIIGLEVRWQTRDGRTLFIRENARAVRGQDGTVLYYEGTVEDITERKQAERALRESEEKFRSVSEQSPNMIFINRQGRVVYANRKCQEEMGYSREEFYAPGFDFLRLVAPESVELIKSVYARHRRGEEVEPYEYTLLTRTGLRIESVITTRLIDYEGSKAILGIVTDVTERKAAEKRLQESEEGFRRLVEMSPDGIAVHQDGRIVLVNPAGVRALGYDRPEELVGRLVFDIVHPDDRPGVLARIKQVLQLGKPVELVEERFRRKDGSYVSVEAVSAPFYWNGKPAVQVVVRDISGRKELTRVAEETADELRAVLDNSPEAIAAECEGALVYANQRFVRMFGYESPEQVVGRNASDFDAPEDRAALMEYSRMREHGEDAPTRYAFRGLKRDGTIAQMEATISTYRSLGRLHILGFIREIEPGRGGH